VPGQVPRQAGQDHPGGRAGADPLLRGDQGGQAGRIPPGQAGQVQDQPQALRLRQESGDRISEPGGRVPLERAGDGQDGGAVQVTFVQAEQRSGRAEGEADGDQGAVRARRQPGLVGDLADQRQAVAGLDPPGRGAFAGRRPRRTVVFAVVARLPRRAVVADLAAQGPAGFPDPEPAMAGPVAHGVGG